MAFEKIDPNRIPNIDYYLDGIKSVPANYAECPNASEECTIEGFVEALNEITEPFAEASKRSMELYGPF
ncbi:hypothetical protein AGMMS49938_06260 [Fibrobacterales bacterium]|nr:hypothetical protein AGMMS49938_06260 [Fibrobacterales bacterium]